MSSQQLHSIVFCIAAFGAPKACVVPTHELTCPRLPLKNMCFSMLILGMLLGSQAYFNAVHMVWNLFDSEDGRVGFWVYMIVAVERRRFALLTA